jgi:hypothetical protein
MDRPVDGPGGVAGRLDEGAGQAGRAAG